jgi:four helix bundle protein
MEKGKENIILRLTFEFSLEIIKYVDLLESKKKFVIANQLLKSGTSIGANVREAQNAESKQDFIHKLKISAKEIEETEYWLELCKASYGQDFPNLLLVKLIEIKKIVNKIIITSKNKTKAV